jgi:glycosyltransferase involved in cell wall biosynthesis
MSTTLDLGIVVPLYNKAAAVRRSVGCLLDQTVRAAQVVVVDDGSTDDSVAQLAPLAERITLVRQANAGPSAARNRGVALLTTAWVAFADADNLWSPDRLERVAALQQRHPGVDWLTGRYWNCSPDGRRTLVPPLEHGKEVLSFFDDVGGLPGLGCSETLVVRRTLLDEVGGFNERLRCYEITQLYLQLAARCPRAGFVAEPTVEVLTDTASSLFAQKRHSPPVLLAYAEELLRLHQRLTPPPAYLTDLIAQVLQACVYFACEDGDYDLARRVLRGHGRWLKRSVGWKLWGRCLVGRLWPARIAQRA